MVGENIYDQVIDPKYRQINLLNSNEIIFANDLHGDVSALEKLIEKAGKNTVLDIRDIASHAGRSEIFEKLGYKSGQEVEFDYLASNLSESEVGALQMGNQIEQFGGLDKFVELVQVQNPTIDKEQLLKQVTPLYDSFKTKEFSQKLEELIKNRPEEISEKIKKSQFELQVANYLMDRAEVNSIKKAIGDNKKNLSFIVGGNHDGLQFYGLLNQAVDNVYYSDAVEGVSKVGSGENEIRFITPENVHNMVPPSEAMVYGNNVAQIFPGQARLEGVVENLTAEQLDSMDEKTLRKMSPYFRKIVGDGEVPKNLDVVLSHFRPGKLEGSPIADLTDPGVAYFSKSTPVLSGHIHKKDSGKTNLCDNFEQGFISSVTKTDGELNIEHLDIDFNSNGKIDYLSIGGYSTIGDLKAEVDKIYEEQMSKSDVIAKIGPEEAEKKRAA